jgi:cholinesterase
VSRVSRTEHLNEAEISNASIDSLVWTPVVDNVTFAQNPRASRLSSTTSNSNIARVPVLVGTNADEGRLYSAGVNDTISFLHNLIPGVSDDQINTLLAAYPLKDPFGVSNTPGAYQNPREQLGALLTDYLFQCPARLLHQESSQVGVQTYRYYYNASFPNSQIFDDAGVYHRSEVGMVLGSYSLTNDTVWQQALSRYLGNTWAHFAKNKFKAWAPGPNAMAVFGGGVRAEDGTRASGSYIVPLNRTAIDELDRRCSMYQSFYDAATK